MKTLNVIKLTLLLAAFACLAPALRGATPSELLQRGLYAEEVEGDLKAAITNYAEVAGAANATRPQIAQALYRQGMCYLKVKDEAGARTSLQKLAADYSDQTELVDKARLVLEDLTNFDPATLMPVNTLLYLELGSPGRQIETLVTMLKGTPYENPLAAMGGRPANESQPSPANLIAALLNPSMLAEFKKIRSSAIGITSFSQHGPPSCVAVLYPGKSDALRGILLAALGMAGKPASSIEGMNVVLIQDMVGVAYDDKVIIATQPAKELGWSVKQYKGTLKQPTLASRNDVFSKLTRKQRQEDVLTLWMKTDEAYAKALELIPPDDVPKEMLTANAFADFKNMDCMTLSFSLRDDGIGCNVRTLYKASHQSLAFGLIHTPNLNPRALDVVPAGAIAFASFALNGPDSAQVAAAQNRIQQVTGLDLGREVFANLQQVTLFLMPPGSKQTDPKLALIESLGIALTSRNPGQTRDLLARMFSIPNLIHTGEANAAAGKFQMTPAGQANEVFAYLEQVNGTTLVTASKQVLDSASASLRAGKSARTSGPLAKSIASIQPTAAKVLMANAGGLVDLLAQNSDPGNMSAAKQQELEVQVKALAQAVASTTVQLRSDEQPNELALSISVEGLPPLHEIMGPINTISRISEEAAAEARSTMLRQQMPAVVAPVASAPAIDGEVDAVWAQGGAHVLSKAVFEKPANGSDLAAQYRTLWDENNLYFLVEVTDDILRRDHDEANWFQDDGVEIYIDATNAKRTDYGSTDYHYSFRWNSGSLDMREARHQRTQGVQSAMVKTASGYRLEVRFPWATLGAKPSSGAQFGLDVHINDNDSGKRDSKVVWRDGTDLAYMRPELFGNAVLGGMIGWWKFDEEQGTAMDSSGGNHNGTPVGEVQRKPGRLGRAIDLNGKGFVQVPAKEAFNLASQVTVACWMNLRSVSTGWMAVVSKGDTSWRLSTVDLEPRLHFSVHGHWEGNSRLDSASLIAPNEWHHVAAVYSGEEMSLYIDGKRAAVQPRTGPMGQNAFDVLIGDNAEQKGRGFNGLLDDVRVYNYALPETEIVSLAKIP